MNVAGVIVVFMLACAPLAQASAPDESLKLITTLVSLPQHIAVNASLERQRQQFKLARKALNKNDIASFHRLKSSLQGYPLTPYLNIWHARKELDQGNEKLAIDALDRYADVPEAINLRIAWIKQLAKRGAWPKVADLLDKHPSDIRRLPEISMLSDWHNGSEGMALEQFSKRWINGKKASELSKTLRSLWLKQGHPNTKERWQRIENLASQGKWKKIKAVASELTEKERKWLTYWRKLQKEPEKEFARWPTAISAPASRAILNDVLVRLSRADPTKAQEQLQRIKKKESKRLNKSFFNGLEKSIALRAAKRHMPEAALWLQKLPQVEQNKETRAWQTRLHLLKQDWKQVANSITAMPAEEQQQSNWTYWKARSLEETGFHKEATTLFSTLATERGYYSFLSAERVQQPFTLVYANFQTNESELSNIAKIPSIIRAKEWLQLGNQNKASREWHFALSGSSHQTWEAAATLAYSWGWHNQVIRAAYKADRQDALEQRFPLAHKKEVMQAANQTGLTSSTVWSIIRQESAFNHKATSYVGARGLMQLMPKTARAVAKRLKLKNHKRPDLFSPATNITLGAQYLAEQKKRFGNLALASAAYNAGPHRVSKWLQRTPFIAGDTWVEAIPFNETRRYVQQVMAFVSVYEWRQAKTLTSLTARLNDRVQEVSSNKTP